MSGLFSTLEDRVAYLKQQAVKLKKDSIKAEEAGNLDEAKRLSDLAYEAEYEALSIEDQLRNSG